MLYDDIENKSDFHICDAFYVSSPSSQNLLVKEKKVDVKNESAEF